MAIRHLSTTDRVLSRLRYKIRRDDKTLERRKMEFGLAVDRYRQGMELWLTANSYRRETEMVDSVDTDALLKRVLQRLAEVEELEEEDAERREEKKRRQMKYPHLTKLRTTSEQLTAVPIYKQKAMLQKGKLVTIQRGGARSNRHPIGDSIINSTNNHTGPEMEDLKRMEEVQRMDKINYDLEAWRAY